MPNVLIRDVPEDTHSLLQRRAQDAGQSLQQYLLTELTRLAAAPTLNQVLDRIASRQGGRVGLAVAVADLERERADR